MVLWSKAWTTTFLFKVFFLWKRSIWGGIFLTNKHMFLLDGHGSHVIFEAIEQAQAFRLDTVTLPSHTWASPSLGGTTRNVTP
jgi:hypothetical protein